MATLPTIFREIPIDVHPGAPRVVIRRVVFELYTATPAISIFGSSVHIIDSLLSKNRRGAIYIATRPGELAPFLEILNTTFDSNGPVYRAGECVYDDSGLCGDVPRRLGGAIESYGGYLAISGSTFTGNIAHYGGALYNDGAFITLEDRTLFGAGNWAQEEGFSIYVRSGWLRYLLPAPLGHWVGPSTEWIPRDDQSRSDGADHEISYQLGWRWQRDTPGTPGYLGYKEYDGRLVAPVTAAGYKDPNVYASPIDDSTGIIQIYNDSISHTLAIDETYPFECAPGFYRSNDDMPFQDGQRCEAVCRHPQIVTYLLQLY